MVDFVAYRAVDITELLELGHLADTGPADIHHQSSSGLTITQGDGPAIFDFVIKGSGIKYFNGVPIDGTITSLRVVYNGDVAYKFDNDKYSVSEALKLYLANDELKAAKQIFKGKDDLRGSDDADTLDGFGGNDVIRGGGGDDSIQGSDGNDKIFGEEGSDLLKGNKGNDKFCFDTAIGSDVDRIAGFDVDDDRILLDKDIFAGFVATGTLAAAAFVIGTAAVDDDDRIVYDAESGDLFFDADGGGAGAAVLFATLSRNLDLTNGDFSIVA